MFNCLSPSLWLLAIVPFDIEFWLLVHFNMHTWKKIEMPNRIKYSFEVMVWLWEFSAYALAVLLAKTIDVKYGFLICLSVCISTAYLDMNIMLTNIIGMPFVSLRLYFHY